MENISLKDSLGTPITKSEKIEKIRKIIFYVFGILIFFSFFFFLFLSAPTNFPAGTMFSIGDGSSLRSISLQLKRAHFIRSRTAFEAFVIIFGKEKHIISSSYYFENKLPVWEVARRIAKGEHHLAPVTVTIPEGFTLNQIGDVFVSKLANFSKVLFLQEAKNLEGYLFPDTYFFLINADEKDVIKSMTDNFNKKIALFRPDMVSFYNDFNEKNIIIMASIIEHEAKGDSDRGVISEILWRRIFINMPLQVDAAPETYKTKGLPKNPICNPGLESIKAATYPGQSQYLYYLHDKAGMAHYAKTFAEHQANIRKYLK